MPTSPFTPLAFGQGSKPLGSRKPLATYKGHSHEIEPSKVGSVLPDRSERRADSRGFVIDAGSESPVPRDPGFVIPLSPGNNYGRVPPNLSVWTTTTQSFSPSEVSKRSHFKQGSEADDEDDTISWMGPPPGKFKYNSMRTTSWVGSIVKLQQAEARPYAMGTPSIKHKVEDMDDDIVHSPAESGGQREREFERVWFAPSKSAVRRTLDQSLEKSQSLAARRVMGKSWG